MTSDDSGWEFKNGGEENAVQRAFRLITEGKDVLDALIAGVILIAALFVASLALWPHSLWPN